MRALFLFMWVTLIIAAGFTVYHITFQVETLEARLSSLNEQIRSEQEAVHILKAEWAYLNRPDRLDSLTATILPTMAPPQINQIITIQDLPQRTSLADSLADSLAENSPAGAAPERNAE